MGVPGAGEGRGHREAGGQADRGLQGAGDDHRDAGRQLGGAQGGGDAPDALGLDDQHVGGVQPAHLDDVLYAPDRHLGGDRHRAAAAERGQVVEAGDRVLDQLDLEAGEAGQRADRLVDVPGAVGVDPDPDAGADRLPHRPDPGLPVAGRRP